MATLNQKIQISAGSALLFALVSLPLTYQLTSRLIQTSPNNLFLLHTLVFALITFLTMGDPRINTKEKLRNTIYGTLIFYFFASPTYSNFLSNLLGNPAVLLQLGAQALLFFLALVGVMYL